VIFLQLQDNDGGIPAERMRERMHQVFINIHHRLDDREIDNFTTFCFGAANKEDHEGHTWWEKFRSSVEIDDHSAFDVDLCDHKINSTKFSEACASNESIGFQDVVDLFDADRHRGCLERIFTPLDMKSYVEASKGTVAQTDLKPRLSKSASSLSASLEEDRSHRQTVTSSINDMASLIGNLETRLTDLEQRACEHEKKVTTLGSDVAQNAATLTQMAELCLQQQQHEAKEDKRGESAQAHTLEALQSQVHTLERSLDNIRDEAWHCSQSRQDLLDRKISELVSHILGSDPDETAAAFTQLAAQTHQQQHEAKEEERDQAQALQYQVQDLGRSPDNRGDKAWHGSLPSPDILDARRRLISFLGAVQASSPEHTIEISPYSAGPFVIAI